MVAYDRYRSAGTFFPTMSFLNFSQIAFASLLFKYKHIHSRKYYTSTNSERFNVYSYGHLHGYFGVTLVTGQCEVLKGKVVNALDGRIQRQCGKGKWHAFQLFFEGVYMVQVDMRVA